MTRSDWTSLAALMGMTLLFGASFTGTKLALQSFTPFQLLFLRFAISSICFAAIWRWIPRITLIPGDYIRLFLLALMEPGLYFFLEVEGVQRTLASTAAVLISTIPLFVLALEASFLKVKVRLLEFCLIVASFWGIFLLVASGKGGGLGGSVAGNGLILLAAFSAAVYTILAKTLLTRIPVLSLTFFQSLFATLAYLPLAAHDCWKNGLPSPSRQEGIALLYLGIFCSFAAYTLLNYCLSRMRASFVSAFANLIPVVGIAVAFLVLGERLLPLQVVGAIIVLLCMTGLTLFSPGFEKGPAIHTEG